MIIGLEDVLKADSARSTKIDCTERVSEYVNKEDWRIKANANTGYSHAGLVNNLSGAIIANFWLDKVYSKPEGDAHRNGDYHIHDLDQLAPYCFTNDTLIKTVEYNDITIGELIEKNINEFTVISFDIKTGKKCKKRAYNLACTRKDTEILKLIFNDGSSVKCTPDHLFLLRSGEWKKAFELRSDDCLMTINRKNAKNYFIYPSNIERKGDKADVYCMSVKDTECFTLGNGIIVHNCCGHDLGRLLNEGFNGVQGRVSSTAPKHLREALYQMANFIGILQAEWAGAQAFSSFDTFLAPYVFFDKIVNKISDKDIKKAILNFIYNVNVPSRWGQSPFSNVTIDIIPPQDMAMQYPLRNEKNYFVSIIEEALENDIKEGEKILNLLYKAACSKRKSAFNEEASQEEKLDEISSLCYSDFKDEMILIDKAFYECLNEGDINGQPFTFPIPTINITEDFPWKSSKYDFIFENARKYGSSYFQNFIGSQYKRDENGKLVPDPDSYKPTDVRSMCCRLQLSRKELRKKGGGLFGADSQTGCYDEKTEVLTENGWKYFKDVKLNDRFYVLTPTREIKLFNPSNIFVYNVDDSMCRFKTSTLDLFVTKDHRMLLTNKNDKMSFKKAQDCGTNICIPLRGYWYKDSESDKISASAAHLETWLKFMGLFISEGSISGSRGGKSFEISKYKIEISQSKKKNIEIISKVMDDMTFYFGFKVNHLCNKKGVHTWTIYNKELWNELKSQGDSFTKYIPKILFSLPVDKLKILFDYLMLGDGCITKNGHKKYYTSSAQLRDDMQHLGMLLGMGSNYFIDKRNIKVNYCISFHKAKNRYVKDSYALEHYKGKVYCVEVPYNTLYVRRNGKTTWCGNSIGVVTINLPRIGYLSKDNEDEYFARLKKLLNYAKSTLEKKRKFVQDMMDRGLYPYTKRYVRTLDTFFSTIGIIGMNESIRNFTDDKENITTKYGQEFAKKVMMFIRKILIKFQEETGNMYNLEATPAEGTTYRLAKSDIEKFGDIENFDYTIPGENSDEKDIKYIICKKHGKVEVPGDTDDTMVECPICIHEVEETPIDKSL